jgi:hypothetical protein
MAFLSFVGWNFPSNKFFSANEMNFCKTGLSDMLPINVAKTIFNNLQEFIAELIAYNTWAVHLNLIIKKHVWFT